MDDSILQSENRRLRDEFVIRGLELDEVYRASEPVDLALENRQLAELLEWTDTYREHPDREEMAAMGFHFPPVYPDISPDSDWRRFERWMRGLPIRRMLHESLPAMLHADFLRDEKVEDELDLLIDNLHALGVGVELQADLPPRLAYSFLWEILGDDELEALAAGGGMVIDGCDGYCPGCPQRPWCVNGTSLCFDEDAVAGHMILSEELSSYASSAPGSLAVLRSRDPDCQ
ncbi:MAG: hypothetical protein ACYTGH_07800 [Planctomycetota bacterium]|jgi:hypothetical protein